MTSSSVEVGSNVTIAGDQNSRMGGFECAEVLGYHFELGSELKCPKLGGHP